MNVSLTHELEEFVNNKVQSGSYTSASDVVRDGLRLLVERDQLHHLRLEELRKEIKKGLGSGEAKPFAPQELKRKIHARIAQESSRP
jgi:antitoxin ParD1/3/4